MITPIAPQSLQTSIVPMGRTTPPPLPEIPVAQAATPETPMNRQLINSLASFIRSHWERAKQERISSGIEERMIRAKQARALVYDEKKLSEIRALMGSTYEPPYMPLIETKCRAAEDWITDVYFQAGAKPYGIENTPDPDVPKEVEATIRSAYSQEIAMEIISQRTQAGAQGAQGVVPTLDPASLDAEIEAALAEKTKIIQYEIKRVAKELTEKFEVRVDDRLREGGWYEELRKVVHDIVTFPAAFLKGPEERNFVKRTRRFEPALGRYVTTYDHKPQEKFERVSPVNVYPLVGSRTCKDGLIERTQYSPMELQDMIGVDGFSEVEIRSVLTETQSGGLREWTSIDSRLATLDNKSTNTLYMGDNIDALIFWGQVPGKHLGEWGMDKSIIKDTDKWYRIYAILIGNHVIMARLNPNPDGNVPYYKASFVEDPDKFWNMAVPDVLWGHQVTANAVFRACGYNAGMASGPIIEQDIERCADDGPLHPYKRFKVTSNQMQANSPAIRLYNIQLIVGQLSNFYEFLMTLADFDSGVPRIAHGGSTPGGVTDTASGTSMFLSQSARGIKGVIGHLDTGIAEPSVSAEYFYIIDNDDTVKLPAGDMRIVAKGSSALVAREQETIRLREMLTTTNNPVDMQIIGLDGRRQMLRDSMKSLPMDIEKILPEEKDIIGQMTGEPQSVPGAPGEAKPIATAALLPSGDKAAGQDFSLFNQGAA